MRCLNTKIGGIDVSETDEPQGFEHTYNILNINQSSPGVVTRITNKLKSTLKQLIIIAHGNKRIDCRITFTLRIMIMKKSRQSTVTIPMLCPLQF